MNPEPVILDSARKHGVADEDLLYAVAFALWSVEQHDGMTMFIGPDRAGNLIEVGTIVLADGAIAIAHGDRPARPKYTNAMTKPRRKR